MSDITNITDTDTRWLSADDLATARGRLPMVYVDAVPVRTDDLGQVHQIGLLLRFSPSGAVTRSFVSGRVLYGELVREALLRHLERDLGPLAIPQVPTSPVPFTVAEYFPDPTRTGFHDPRQHAVSLAFVVPVIGDCVPSTDSLDLMWATPEEAASMNVRAEMMGGHDRLLMMALAHVGKLP
jgi:ADP-ribose pyrophosphatase YjhB (NUDIX family)